MYLIALHYPTLCIMRIGGWERVWDIPSKGGKGGGTRCTAAAIASASRQKRNRPWTIIIIV